jgi:hypothetical protein
MFDNMTSKCVQTCPTSQNLSAIIRKTEYYYLLN